MPDLILIEGLKVRATVGVKEHEREVPQDIVLDLQLSVDLESAARQDDLKATVDYEKLALAIERRVIAARRLTLEAVAWDVAGMCLQDTRVESVRVRVDKPAALRNARGAAVVLRRESEDF